jgi:predicted 3-demethylubiquinone-9 3-methyltransferase (glyoxalase superfamily)
MTSISPFLWFDNQAEDAANLYVSAIPNTRILEVRRWAEGSPFPAGSAMSVSMSFDGVTTELFNGGPMYKLTEAFSLFVSVDTQEEIDRIWDALSADGGQPSRCGWITDRYGVTWQIVPSTMFELIGGSDPAKAAAANQAMMGMSKLVIADLQAARDAA